MEEISEKEIGEALHYKELLDGTEAAILLLIDGTKFIFDLILF